MVGNWAETMAEVKVGLSVEQTADRSVAEKADYLVGYSAECSVDLTAETMAEVKVGL